MANLKINLPLQTGSVEHDFNELYSWADRLVSELRTLLHVIDSSNIRSLDAAKLTGSIDISRLTGTAPELYIGSGGITLTDEDGTEKARIYRSGRDLMINAAGNVYVNGERIGNGI